MAGGDLAEKRVRGEEVYSGVLLRVQRDVVRLPDGREGVREYIRHPGAAAIIAVTDAGELVMERQYRYPVGREMIELPAGKLDPGEAPLASARRELREETGYTARYWRHLAGVHLAIGYSDERIEFYLARGLKHQGSKLDHEEFIDVFTLPLAKAIAWVEAGRITDAKTVSGLFWAEKVLGGKPARRRR